MTLKLKDIEIIIDDSAEVEYDEAAKKVVIKGGVKTAWYPYYPYREYPYLTVTGGVSSKTSPNHYSHWGYNVSGSTS